MSELPIITASTFTTRSPNNTPLANRASISAILNLLISLAFVEANYEVLGSLLRDRRRHVCNEDVRTELDYYSEEYDEEREMEPRPTRALNRDESRVERESDGRRLSEQRVEDGRSHEGNLPQLLAAYLGRNENGQPLQSTLTFGYGGNQPSITLGGNSISNGLEKFQSHFSEQEKFTKTHLAMHNIKQMDEKALGLSLLAKEVATNGDPNDHKEGFDKFSKGFSLDNNKGRKKNWERFSPYKGSNHGLLGNLVKSPSSNVSHPLPRGIGTILSSYEPNKVEEVQKKIKESVLVAMKGMLSCTGAEERIVVNNQYLEQTVVIGKQLPTSFKRKLQELLRANADVFAWTYADMTGIPKTIMVDGQPFNTEHKLNEYKHIEPIEQKNQGLAPE
ncbi:hypothetical protein Tco_1466086 [Tanacetum coccineum]